MDKMSYLSPELKDPEKSLNELANVTLKSVYLISTGNNLQEALVNNEKAIPRLEKLKADGFINQYTNVSTVLISKSLQNKRIQQWNSFWTDDKVNKLNKNILQAGEKYKFKENAIGRAHV